MVRITRRFKKRKRNWRMALLWILSSLLFLLASIMTTGLRDAANSFDYLVGFLTSLLLYLFATLFLIATTIVAKEEIEWI